MALIQSASNKAICWDLTTVHRRGKFESSQTLTQGMRFFSIDYTYHVCFFDGHYARYRKCPHASRPRTHGHLGVSSETKIGHDRRSTCVTLPRHSLTMHPSRNSLPCHERVAEMRRCGVAEMAPRMVEEDTLDGHLASQAIQSV